jgi:plastocyanin
MRSLGLAAALAAPLVVAACGDTAPTTAPTAPSAFAHAAQGDTRLVQMMDACDPASFDAAIGPGTCTRAGGVRFENFISLLGRHQAVGSWHFAPATINARVGQTLLAFNQGGEVHTFTEVAEFGGGIVPDLNLLSGNPVPAPECLALTGPDFVPPGGSDTEEVEEPGTERYMCCIHPWMRAVVEARP